MSVVRCAYIISVYLIRWDVAVVRIILHNVLIVFNRRGDCSVLCVRGTMFTHRSHLRHDRHAVPHPDRRTAIVTLYRRRLRVEGTSGFGDGSGCAASRYLRRCTSKGRGYRGAAAAGVGHYLLEAALSAGRHERFAARRRLPVSCRRHSSQPYRNTATTSAADMQYSLTVLHTALCSPNASAMPAYRKK